MLKVKNLSVRYKNNNEYLALKNINFKLNAGQIGTIIGPSGCGKSTLIHSIAGIINHYQGSISFNDEQLDVKKNKIGLISQNYGLLPWKKVIDNSLLGLRVKKDTLNYNEVNSILEELGIDQLKDRYPNELSGGQKQRVSIARAFILKPDLLLMDEPFSALDAITRENMGELFLRTWKEHKVTTLLITHSIEEAVLLGKKIIIMSGTPGMIIKMIDNPLFDLDQVRTMDSYYKLVKDIRNCIKEVWVNEI